MFSPPRGSCHPTRELLHKYETVNNNKKKKKREGGIVAEANKRKDTSGSYLTADLSNYAKSGGSTVAWGGLGGLLRRYKFLSGP